MTLQAHTHVEAAKPQLIITRVIGAIPRLAFDAWTAPEHLAHWCGPTGFSLSSWEMVFRVGGSYRLCLRSPRGREHCVRGTFLEIVDMERIVFTHWRQKPERSETPATLVMVRFAAEGPRTKVTLRHAGFDSDHARDLHQTFWEQSRARLVDYARSLRIWPTASTLGRD